MNIILLSGGSGKRLWPLSNDVRSKQFIKLFKNNDEYESSYDCNICFAFCKSCKKNVCRKKCSIAMLYGNTCVLWND